MPLTTPTKPERTVVACANANRPCQIVRLSRRRVILILEPAQAAGPRR
jgi:hypothetical protein